MEQAEAQPPEEERRLAHFLGLHSSLRAEVVQMIRALPQSQPFVMKDKWLDLSSDVKLEDWRRLEAYRLLIHRAVRYPCDLSEFVQDVISPLGVAADLIVDETIAQHVPVERTFGDRLLMAPLPMMTDVGYARLFMVIDKETSQVKRAGIFPYLEGVVGPEGRLS